MTVTGVERRRDVITVAIGAALAVLMGVVLAAGIRQATRLHAEIAALQTASSLQNYPEDIARELDTLRERLEIRAYSGRALADLRATVSRFDASLRATTAGDVLDAADLARTQRLWHQYDPVLAPVLAFHGQPYADSDTSGSTLSREGRAHFAQVKRAQLFAAVHAKALQDHLVLGVRRLQASASAAAAQLRALLLAGVLAALVLAAAAAYLQITRARDQRAAREAEERTRDILKTVREGFFLLDRDNRIGSVWSEALTRMFNRGDFADLSFEDLLRDLVPATTLATAVKYVNLLWGDRAHENLMKSINPLGQLEVTAEDGRGGTETRYLQFDFHRVVGPKGVRHVLCAVGDVTSSVLLARELQESQQSANAQLDMMVGMMRTDPVQLASFLDSADAGLKHVNAILKEPARTDTEFRRKPGSIMRELHSLKGEAAALDLHSIADRLHALEDLVGNCQAKATLSGDDFLPVVVKLDELLAYLRGVREMASRISVSPQSEAVPAGDVLAATLQTMAAQLARDHAKRFTLNTAGLGGVPPQYARTLKDCLIQLVRNAAVHGIEAPEVRSRCAKSDVGRVSAEFRAAGANYELIFEDDGAGIAPEALKETALRRNLITAAEASSMDMRGAMALMFRPGFSTADGASRDAGRGVGMDVIARNVYALGGRIGVSTNPGKFTRFKITLPAVEAAGSSAVA